MDSDRSRQRDRQRDRERHKYRHTETEADRQTKKAARTQVDPVAAWLQDLPHSLYVGHHAVGGVQEEHHSHAVPHPCMTQTLGIVLRTYS